jgi:hypothetical protein
MKNGEHKVLYARLSPQDHHTLEQLAALETVQRGKKISLQRMVELLIRQAATHLILSPTPSETEMGATGEP